MLEHERDPSLSLRKKYLRCGSREGRSRVCTYEYAYLCSHTHLLQQRRAHICIASHIPAHRHTAVHVSTNNPFTRPCKHHQCTPRYHLFTLVHYTLTVACTLKHRPTEQRPKAHRGRDTSTVPTKLPPRESSQKSTPASHPAASLLPGFTEWPHRL